MESSDSNESERDEEQMSQNTNSNSASVTVRGHPFMTSTRRGARGSGSGGRMWTGGRRSSPMWTSTQKIKLKSTDVILSSSHAKKLASFYQNFVFGQKKSGNFSAI